MKWEKEAVKVYEEAKEYVDTLCVPLSPISLKNAEIASRLANQNKSIHILANELERQYMGRIFLSPGYIYSQSSNFEEEVSKLNQWVKAIYQKEFPHIFYLTYDVKWKKVESYLDGTLIWIPASKIEDYQSRQAKEEIQNQMHQISELIRTFW
ncbi:DUF2487 family protein [Gracilibacillus sp. YIM 98692]|uniref:DUF2487 family protein n=1 Tax=Gracilibacillus sp. YIM 98692 TaxID=2663532 RepID=UPI0013D20392|nr:DUF2487 family protein [Gracilibacillus sp. YIM 98692]